MKTLAILNIVLALNGNLNLHNVRDRVTFERADDVTWRQTVAYQPGFSLGQNPFNSLEGSWERLPAVSLDKPIRMTTTGHPLVTATLPTL